MHPNTVQVLEDGLKTLETLPISSHASRSGDSYHNVSKAVDFWQKHGLLTEITQQQRNRIFAAPEVFRLTSA